MTDGIVNIHGKAYQTVAYRVQTFREQFPEYGLRTRILESSPEFVVMVAEIWKDGFLLATGHAEEKRGSTQINRTSALENCETSAIGRALAAMGIGGTEFASANEVQNAVRQQNEGEFITKKQVQEINKLIKETGADSKKFLEFCNAETVDTISTTSFQACVAALEAKRAVQQKKKMVADAAREPGSDDE